MRLFLTLLTLVFGTFVNSPAFADELTIGHQVDLRAVEREMVETLEPDLQKNMMAVRSIEKDLLNDIEPAAGEDKILEPSKTDTLIPEASE